MNIREFEFQTYPPHALMDLKFYYCGTENCVPGHSVGPMLRDYYKIHYIHSGTGIYSTGGQTYKVEAGQGFLVFPEVLSYYCADKEEPWTYSWVAFNGLQVEQVLKQSALSETCPVFDAGHHDDYIRNCFIEMFKADEPGFNRELRLQGALYSFLAAILSPDRGSRSREDMQAHYIGRVIALIQQNYATNIHIETIAHTLGLNRKYLSKMFKQEMGITPQQYLIHFRMNRACELLQNPMLTIGEIASSVGYQDQLLFSKIFKRTLTVSPREYRQRRLAEQNPANS
ncbi:HTH-type transcriptional regulator YesS [compost metagenome]